MGTQVILRHRSEYRYDRAVVLGPQVIQLRPTPHCRTPILNYSLDVTPADHILRWQLDPHANHLARVLFPNKTSEFLVEVNLVADLTPVNPFAFFLDPGFEQFPFEYPPELAHDLEPYRTSQPAGPNLTAFVHSLRGEPQSTVAFLVELNRRMRDRIGYVTRLEHGVQTCEETLTLGTGSCRDSAWLFVRVLRELGLAARFVSGYLIQLASDEAVDGPQNDLQADSADLHAWVEVYLPGAGWIGMDATSGLFTAEGHIPLVCTPSAAQAAPIGGTVEPAQVDFTYSMSVRRLNEEPRLTKPFSAEAWEQVRAVAHRVDRELEAQDVRLTMGGEPTFVGIDEPESPQWNIEALGPLKRTRGLALIRALRQREQLGAMLHYGQGKWYPGEALPRWAFSCFSRTDGVPVWENVNLIPTEDQSFDFNTKDALVFILALALRLQVSPENVLPAYNPDSVGEAKPAGYILPIRRRQPDRRLAWSSQLWFPAPERLVLSMGDSPIGYRIPVAALPFVAPDELVYERDSSTNLVQLPAHTTRRLDLFTAEPVADSLPPLSGTAEDATVLIRPALCVQAREGRLHVFFPFVAELADYLDLVAAVEDTSQYLDKPVWLEGYTPPSDPRLRAFSLTPDPGVLEVNLPPAAGWDELETINQVLFEEALADRLRAEKFGYDGSHIATGGGSHIVIGGATREQSPLLRRPDLLRSMVSFWQNHPSLSYLFSGMYVGPTSQYPRVDEARTDALYELEVAFTQLPASVNDPSILDGLFRNLLVDVTGNSHRAEFCIDKLYPPEGQGLRLGLLELRAFEMPPHFRMGLLAMLLVRALVSTFWKQPFAGELVRWGNALHDRFMLPHFVRRDFSGVLDHLRQSGFPFEETWFAAQFEFRFPKIGAVAAEGVELELRQALEPWNVLAEETTSGGTGRSVDSSLERMQARLSGFGAGSRYIVACNGRRVPLQPTEAASETVAGIRYRARKLSAALHPTIPVHTPLVFDLIDTWKERSIARCTYHAGPPDGTVHTSRPADATEAKARRMQRFEVAAHPPSTMPAPPEEQNHIFPMTLDLRWPPPAESPLGEP